MTVNEILIELKSLGTEDHLRKMKGFGNDADEVFGVNVNTMTC